mmetsp:Transcript_11838/g.37604  ORF Transcript_11838/g.37604 Transcript_11838/m.37604 type:complete len:379 (-) Transcript_11838:258-1394(-)
MIRAALPVARAAPVALSRDARSSRGIATARPAARAPLRIFKNMSRVPAPKQAAALGGMEESRARRAAPVRAQADDVPSSNEDLPTLDELRGEDAAVFNADAQTKEAWTLFFGLLTGVLGLIFVVWINPSTGMGTEYMDWFKSFSDSTEITMLLILLGFGVAHSGLAGLRPYAEKVVGERAYRVFFALVSLPLAISSIVYFINHRYTGTPLWDVRGVPGVHDAVWWLSFISFFFLYPSTFNILEVAAVDKPKLHLWETGIMRITRHPQAVGQGIWCLAHTIWIGNTFVLATSFGLMAHHIFGCWHGDRRLKAKYGDTFEAVKSRTSTWPFAAIMDGRQQLPPDYYKEFLRVPYAAIIVFTLGAYFSHPLMQTGAHMLPW